MIEWFLSRAQQLLEKSIHLPEVAEDRQVGIASVFAFFLIPFCFFYIILGYLLGFWPIVFGSIATMSGAIITLMMNRVGAFSVSRCILFLGLWMGLLISTIFIRAHSNVRSEYSFLTFVPFAFMVFRLNEWKKIILILAFAMMGFIIGSEKGWVYHDHTIAFPLWFNETFHMVLFFTNLASSAIFFGYLTYVQHQSEMKLRQSLHNLQIEMDKRKQAETASESKSNFMARMSHELRTPLNAILGYSELLIEELDDILEEKDKYLKKDLQKIHLSGTHLLRLIGNVLDLSKIESGKLTVYEEPVRVDLLAQELLEELHLLLHKHGNQVSFQCVDTIKWLQCDRTKLRQILYNLLSNAGKFTKDGNIFLRIMHSEKENDPSKKSILLEVQDTGIGIKSDDLKKVFETYAQVDMSSTRSYEGTGLGLTISQKLAEQMQGELTAESQFGKGSTFRLSLPQK